jgi:methyl coenzyme M reductase subunit D
MMGIFNSTIEFHQNYEITPDVLKIRCDTIEKLIKQIEQQPFQFEKDRLIRKVNRVIDYTKYGVRIAKKQYSQYAMETIYSKFEQMQLNIITNNYTNAKECIKHILIEKNSYF